MSWKFSAGTLHKQTFRGDWPVKTEKEIKLLEMGWNRQVRVTTLFNIHSVNQNSHKRWWNGKKQNLFELFLALRFLWTKITPVEGNIFVCVLFGVNISENAKVFFFPLEFVEDVQTLRTSNTNLNCAKWRFASESMYPLVCLMKYFCSLLCFLLIADIRPARVPRRTAKRRQTNRQKSRARRTCCNRGRCSRGTWETCSSTPCHEKYCPVSMSSFFVKKLLKKFCKFVQTLSIGDNWQK